MVFKVELFIMNGYLSMHFDIFVTFQFWTFFWAVFMATSPYFTKKETQAQGRKYKIEKWLALKVLSGVNHHAKSRFQDNYMTRTDFKLSKPSKFYTEKFFFIEVFLHKGSSQYDKSSTVLRTACLSTAYSQNLSNILHVIPQNFLYPPISKYPNSGDKQPLGKKLLLYTHLPLLIKNWTVQTWPALAAFIKGVLPPSDSCSCLKNKYLIDI